MASRNQPRDQLAKAREHICLMRAAGSLDEFEERWKSFLHRVDRVWSKAVSKYARSSNWPELKAKYEKLRETDPLLVYLKRARNADEHTIDEIVSREEGGIILNPAEGNVLQVERLVASADRISIRSPQNIRVEFIPAKTRLLPVIDRWGTTPVPTSHLGESIDPTMVVDVAERAATFYEDFLIEVES